MTQDLELPAPTKPARAAGLACRVKRFGGPEVINIEEVFVPSPGPGEVRVKVEAAGVGPWDAWVRSGRSALNQTLPLTPGADLCGRVDAVGENVSQWSTGDEVFGVTNDHFVGAYAQYAIADAHRLARKPARLDAAAAAAVPVVAVTAWQALFEQAQLRKGERVFIHGAAGGVGGFAVQLAAAAGIEVTVTAAGASVDYVKSLRASHVIDHRSVAFEKVVHDVDAVIDLVGGDIQTRSIGVLKPGGVLVSAVAPPDAQALAEAGRRGGFFLVDVTSARLDRIAAMLEQGALKVDVGEVLPMSRVREAHESLDGSRSKPRGKIVIDPRR